MKNLGVILVVVGLAMLLVTGFNYVTKDKVAEVGPVEVNKERTHSVQWSPIVGGLLLVGGIILISTSNKRRIV